MGEDLPLLTSRPNRLQPSSLTKEWTPVILNPLVVVPTYILAIFLSQRAMSLYGEERLRNADYFRRFYYLVVTVLNGWMIVAVVLDGKILEYSWRCQPVNTEKDGIVIPKIVWWFYISKVLELCDTIFNILRRGPISKWQTYHHVCMIFIAWFSVRYLPGGSTATLVFISAVAHFLFYLKPLLVVAGIELPRIGVRWNDAVQIIQFIAVAVNCITIIFSDCEYPKSVGWFLLLFLVNLTLLYVNWFTVLF